MFDGFESTFVETSQARIKTVHGGAGPPVLLLHGFPETHVMWHKVAPILAVRHTVVCTDLRGHGDSSKPPGGESHHNYSKRAMARDQIEVMTALGFERFAVVGHDRGGRVAHRLVLDHSDRVTRLAHLDIVPIEGVLASLTREVADGAYHWFFLTQPYDLPERLIGSDPGFFVRWCLRSWSGGEDEFFAPEAVAEYERCFSDPEMIHATCEDIRALMSIDVADNETDRGRRYACPLLVLWGSRGKPGDLAEPWREWADDVRGKALDSGHFLAEERPDETASELLAFLAEDERVVGPE